MTVQEAIEKLDKKLCHEKEPHKFCRDACMYGEEHCEVLVAIKALQEVEQYRTLGTVEELKEAREKQPKADWIPCEDVLSMSESDFITHILSTICDYAKVNNYEITETVKAMGENLIALTEIANFDKWKEGVTDDE